MLNEFINGLIINGKGNFSGLRKPKNLSIFAAKIVLEVVNNGRNMG